MTFACPEDPVLFRYALGRLPGRDRAAIEEHLSRCDPCRVGVSLATRTGTEETIPLRAATDWSARRWAAAAALAIAIPAAGLYAWKRAGTERIPLPAQQVDGETRRFSDGSLVRKLDAGSQLEWVQESAGTRVHLRLLQGKIQAEIPPGRGAWTLETPAGEVHVLGTTFRVQAFTLPLESGETPAAVVEVLEGAVEIRNAQGACRIPAGHRGVLIGGRLPAGPLGIAPASPDLALRTYLALLAERDPSSGNPLWPAVLGFHDELPEMLLTRLPGIKDPRERASAARLVDALGDAAQRERLHELRQADGQGGAR